MNKFINIKYLKKWRISLEHKNEDKKGGKVPKPSDTSLILKNLNDRLSRIEILIRDLEYPRAEEEINEVIKIALANKFSAIYNRANQLLDIINKEKLAGEFHRMEIEHDKLIKKAPKIYDKFLNGSLDSNSASEQLISLLENTLEVDVRVDCIKFLKKMRKSDEKCFKLFENLLTSESGDHLRLIVCSALIEIYKKKALEPLLWAFEHDKNSFILEY